MKTLSFLLILVSYTTFADCYEKLTQNGDSQHFKVTEYIYDNTSEKLTPQTVINAVQYVHENLDCKRPDINKKEMSCTKDITPWSPICRVNVFGGYFIVSKDYMSTIHLIFNRWD